MISDRVASNLAVTLVSAALCASGQSVELVGSLRNTQGDPLSGKIDIIEEAAELAVTSHSVDEDGEFQISVTTRFGVVVHGSAVGYPPDERYIAPGTQGVVPVDFVLPAGQDLTGRIVDKHGVGLSRATVHVRYDEPNRPLRRSAFHAFESTDGDGYYSLRSVAIDVPLFVDVHAPGYVPEASKRITRSAGDTELKEIILGTQGGTVLVQVIDLGGTPVGGADVVLLADPAGYEAGEHGSLVHGRAYTQQSRSSTFGNVRFAGVPPGRVRIHAWTPSGESKREERVGEGETLRVTVTIR